MVALRRFFSRFSLDALGFSASALCAVHCAVLPLFLVASSYAGGVFAHNHTVENGILGFSFLVGVSSLIPSFLKHHRKTTPLLLFAASIAFIVASRISHELLFETVLTTLGATGVATSHWMNWKFCKVHHSQQANTAAQKAAL